MPYAALATDYDGTLARDGRAGRVVVAAWEAHEEQVRAVARDLRLDLRLSRNKGALMAVPEGVDKGRGTAEALHELGVDAADCVGVGDAENDLTLLALCGLPVAVANAVPAVKRAATLVTRGECGAGVAELVEHLLHRRPPA